MKIYLVKACYGDKDDREYFEENIKAFYKKSDALIFMGSLYNIQSDFEEKSKAIASSYKWRSGKFNEMWKDNTLTQNQLFKSYIYLYVNADFEYCEIELE
jgi:hypothetical protein